MKPIWKYSITAAFALLVFIYLVVGIQMSHRMEQQQPYRHLLIDIQDEDQRQFVTAMEIIRLLNSKGLNPEGKTCEQISLYEVEQTIQQHDMVCAAECYVTAEHDVVVAFTQRVPVLRVLTGAETYLVDNLHEKMPVRPSVKTPMLVATGAVTEQKATHELCDLALWLQQEAFWKQRIIRVHLENPKLAYLYLKDGGYVIILGEVTDYAKKLNRLHRWLEAGECIDVEKYKQVDVRFDGQVVGVKDEE